MIFYGRFLASTAIAVFCCCSVVPAVSAQSRFTTIFGFNNVGNGILAGIVPTGVAVGAGGELYGVTQAGGFTTSQGNCEHGCGVAYSLTPPSSPGGNWTQIVLWTFGTTASDGDFPNDVAMGSDGVLYGTTSGGGAGSRGTVFSLTPPQTPSGTWIESVIWTFGKAGDGEFPLVGLSIDSKGVLYGTTSKGGRHGHGIAFSLTPPQTPGGTWSEKILWRFGNAGDGRTPNSVLVMDHAGLFYGTTSGGGANQYGTAYLLSPPKTGGHWRVSTLQSFTQASGRPQGVAIRDGVLYGVTSPAKLGAGGNREGGIAYSLTPPASPGGAWTQATLATFAHRRKSGHDYNSPIIIDKNGDLLGTTNNDGVVGNATLFKVSPPSAPGGSWTYTTLQSLGIYGVYPIYNGLSEGSPGTFYGTCAYCGTGGTVFSFER